MAAGVGGAGAASGEPHLSVKEKNTRATKRFAGFHNTERMSLKGSKVNL